MNSIEVDVFSDVVCPWCWVGTRRLAMALKNAGLAGNAVVRHHPFMLNPNAPPEGVDIHAMLKARYGRDPKAIFATVEKEAHASGIDMDLMKQPRSHNTLRAHTLIRLAEPKGTQAALVEALFAAHFSAGKNIDDPVVLKELAAQHGFTAAQVDDALVPEELETTRQETLEAGGMGIRGVPFFVFNQQVALSGAQPLEVFEKVLRDAAGARDLHA